MSMWVAAVFAALALFSAVPSVAETVAAGPAPSCDAPPAPPDVTRSRAAVVLNPATAWQPPAGEVIIRLEAAKEALAGTAIWACWRWGNGPADDPASRRPFDPGMVRIRPSDLDRVINFGVVVPTLPPAPEGFLGRLSAAGTLRFAGLGLVPVADLRVIVASNAGILADTVLPVGITNPWFALAVAGLLTFGGLLVLYRFAVVRGAPGLGVIRMVATRDRMASLSAFQILVWSATVAFSGMYVMSLSGNLINITPGTLVLLGVAGATGLATALQPSNPVAAAEQQAVAGQQAVLKLHQAVAAATERSATAAEPEALEAARQQVVRGKAALQRVAAQARTAQAMIDRDPKWADLVAPADGSSGIDITRAQLLFFTLVAAGFVLLKVLNTYIIPDIPEYYQALIGISNGLFVAARAGTLGRRTPDPGGGVS